MTKKEPSQLWTTAALLGLILILVHSWNVRFADPDAAWRGAFFGGVGLMWLLRDRYLHIFHADKSSFRLRVRWLRR